VAVYERTSWPIPRLLSGSGPALLLLRGVFPLLGLRRLVPDDVRLQPDRARPGHRDGPLLPVVADPPAPELPCPAGLPGPLLPTALPVRIAYYFPPEGVLTASLAHADRRPARAGRCSARTAHRHLPFRTQRRALIRIGRCLPGESGRGRLGPDSDGRSSASS